MNLAINITDNPSGGARTQVLNMLKYFNEIEGINIIIYTKKKNLSFLKDVITINNKVIISTFSSISVAFRILWEQFFLPFYLKKNKIDVLFCPANTAPYFSSTKTVQWIGTIGPFWNKIYTYDISLFIKFKLWINKIIMYKSAQKSDAVIFESIYTQKMFQENYDIKLEKSHVIQIGKDDFFHSDINANKELINDSFILCVSHLYFYKNIPRMIDSFAIAKKRTNTKMKLLIAGSKTSNKYQNLIIKRIKKNKLENSVILLGSVSKTDLKYYYSKCDFFIFSSPCENFAYTLVEAMSCGAAILSSNTTAMPETCEDAAIYFNPFDKDDFSNKIELFINNEKLKNKLKLKALKRVKKLPNYQDVTKKTFQIIKNL